MRAADANDGCTFSISTMDDNTHMPALNRFLRGLCLMFLFAVMAGGPAWAAEEDEKRDRDAVAEFEIVTAPVEMDGSVLLRVRGITSLPAEQRAEGIRKRIEQLAADPAFKTDAVQISDNGHFSSVMGGPLRIMAVTDADAHVEQVGRNTLAVAIQDRIRL